MKLQKNCTFLLTGDSVTDCGRVRPVAEGYNGQLGTGYASLVNAFLYAAYPEYNIRVINTGISGNTSAHLLNRWQEDVLDLKPDWVSVLIGINDIWRKLDSPTRPEEAVPLEAYEANVEKMIQQAQAKGINLILMTPFMMDLCKNDTMRSMAEEYSAVCKKLSDKYNTLFVDLQSAFDGFLENHYSSLISADRVHPNLTGHTIIARTLLKTLGFDR